MIQSLPTIRRRIRGIDNTRKVTHAMEMVSAAKLVRVRSSLFSSMPLFIKLRYVLYDFLENNEGISNPLLESRSVIRNIVICVIASDTGLCSAYNHNVFNKADEFIASLTDKKIKLVVVGKEILNHFKNKGYEIIDRFTGIHGRYSDELSAKLQTSIENIYLNGIADEVHIIYSHFDNMLRYQPRVEKLLNIEVNKKTGANYIVEPSANEVASRLIGTYLAENIRIILLHALTSEHAARMIAMRMASDNADDMLSELILFRNKARQAAITKEVIEAASVREALEE